MADRNKPISKGETAPDFTLNDQKGKPFTLSKQKGKRVLLSFQPLAWTPVCQNQMRAGENFDAIKALNTVPVGLSIDSQHSKRGGSTPASRTCACWRISGRTAGWLKLTGSSAKQTASPSGRT